MMVFGYILLVAAIAGLIFGFMQRKKMLTIVAAPFKPTGQVQGGADAAGLISCQGAIRADQPLVAPVSGRQCLYYEIEIKQEWEKHVSTEDGVKKQTGKDTAHTDKTGSLFLVDDGSGPVQVDAREKVDAKLEKSHTEKKSYGWGDISFGNYQVHINRPSDSDKHAIATHLVEKILPAEGDLFVVGKLQGDTITKRDGLLGNLMLAREGRDALMGATKRNMMIGFIAGGVMLLSGAPMAIFGEAPEAAADTCASMSDGLAQPCMGRLYGSSDVIYPWTVLTEGDYRFDTVGTGSDPVMRLWPSIRVLDAAGTEVYTLQGAGGAPAQGQAHFAAGTYNIHVNDTSTGHAANLEGGAGFSLNITSMGGAGQIDQAATAAAGGAAAISLTPGFTPDPHVASGVAGGSVNANTLDANCIGNVGAEPNHVLTATAAFPSLRIMAGSQGDTTLVVQQPDGSYLCNDDTDMLNPVVPLSNAAAGDYRIWVGSIDPTATPAYTLGLTELDSVMPSAL